MVRAVRLTLVLSAVARQALDRRPQLAVRQVVALARQAEPARAAQAVALRVGPLAPAVAGPAEAVPAEEVAAAASSPTARHPRLRLATAGRFVFSHYCCGGFSRLPAMIAAAASMRKIVSVKSS
jgi:hypothetical protein